MDKTTKIAVTSVSIVLVCVTFILTMSIGLVTAFTGTSNSNAFEFDDSYTNVVYDSNDGFLNGLYNTDVDYDNDYSTSTYSNGAYNYVDSGQYKDIYRPDDMYFEDRAYLDLENEACNRIAYLYDALELENPTQCMLVFCDLLNKGSFSQGSFRYKDPENEIDGALGYEVLLGGGVCRNIDELFEYSIEKYGFDSHPVACGLSEGKPANKNDVNHQLSVVNYNGNVFLLDPTSNIACDNKGSDWVFVDPSNNCYNTLHPEQSKYDSGYLLTNITDSEYNEVVDWLNSDTGNYSITDSYFADQQQIVDDILCSDNGREIIDGFNKEMQNNIFSKL